MVSWSEYLSKQFWNQAGWLAGFFFRNKGNAFQWRNSGITFRSEFLVFLKWFPELWLVQFSRLAAPGRWPAALLFYQIELGTNLLRLSAILIKESGDLYSKLRWRTCTYKNWCLCVCMRILSPWKPIISPFLSSLVYLNFLLNNVFVYDK